MIKEISLLSIKRPKKYREHPIKLLEQLAKSISENGLMNPIVVKKLKKITGTQGYELIDGLARIQAFERLQRTSIAAFIKEDNE